MSTKLESLRLFFPAEVTAAYVGIQNLLAANGVQKTEYMTFMIAVVLMLAVINAALYWQLHKTKNIFWQIILAIGFFIWVANVDMARFKDLRYFREYIEIAAPVAVIFYTLLTSLFDLPKEQKNAHA